MRLLALLISFMFAGVPATALAQVDCNNAMTQADMNQCVALDLQKATDEINPAYAGFRRRLSRDKQEELRQVQLAWIGFKDRNCEFEAHTPKAAACSRFCGTAA